MVGDGIGPQSSEADLPDRSVSKADDPEKRAHQHHQQNPSDRIDGMDEE